MSGLTIQQVARQTGLSIDTLRYYERIGLIEPVARDGGGRRRYSEHDLDLIDFVIRMRATGMPLAQVARFADLRRQGDATLGERRAMLEEHERVLAEHMSQLQEHMAVLQRKIAGLKQREAARNEAVGPGPQGAAGAADEALPTPLEAISGR